jgi:predicted patatin/cPLA2 family phospholipase
MILKKLIEFNEKLFERSQKLNERRRLNEQWRRKLRKMKTLSSRYLRKKSKINSFHDEVKDLQKEKIFTLRSNSVMKIHSITATLFNILFRQKNVEIFVVFMKDLNI